MEPWWTIIAVMIGAGLTYGIQTALWRREKSADYRERRMQAYADLHITITEHVGQAGLSFEDYTNTMGRFMNSLLAKAHLLSPEDFQALLHNMHAVQDCIIERAVLQYRRTGDSELKDAALKTYDAGSKLSAEMQSKHWEQIQEYLVSAGMKRGAITMPRPLSPLMEAYRKGDESDRQTAESDKE